MTSFVSLCFTHSRRFELPPVNPTCMHANGNTRYPSRAACRKLRRSSWPLSFQPRTASHSSRSSALASSCAAMVPQCRPRKPSSTNTRYQLFLDARSTCANLAFTPLAQRLAKATKDSQAYLSRAKGLVHRALMDMTRGILDRERYPFVLDERRPSTPMPATVEEAAKAAGGEASLSDTHVTSTHASFLLIVPPLCAASSSS